MKFTVKPESGPYDIAGVADWMGSKFLQIYNAFVVKITVTPGHFMNTIHPSVPYMNFVVKMITPDHRESW